MRRSAPCGAAGTAIGFGNPLRDLADDAAYLAEFLRTFSGPIVLVGHSYGGNVISTAAIDNDQVQALSISTVGCAT
jgi:pimeloyl-ACP methyl ester carboxylesterase